MPKKGVIVGILFILLWGVQTGLTQTDSGSPTQTSGSLVYSQSNPAYQYYMSPGTDNQLLMKVNIWGEVQKPGILQVPDRTDLLSVLSLAGGPKEGAKLSKVKVIRGFNGEKKSWEVDLKKVVKNGDLEKVPLLLPGDTVIVPKGGFRAFSKILTVAYNLAVIVTASALLLN